jgi:hypothetical protein
MQEWKKAGKESREQLGKMWCRMEMLANNRLPVTNVADKMIDK